MANFHIKIKRSKTFHKWLFCRTIRHPWASGVLFFFVILIIWNQLHTDYTYVIHTDRCYYTSKVETDNLVKLFICLLDTICLLPVTCTFMFKCCSFELYKTLWGIACDSAKFNRKYSVVFPLHIVCICFYIEQKRKKKRQKHKINSLHSQIRDTSSLSVYGFRSNMKLFLALPAEQKKPQFSYLIRVSSQSSRLSSVWRICAQIRM